MILTNIHRRTLRIVVVLLVGMIFSPAAAADDYGHAFPAERGGSVPERALPPEPEISLENGDEGPCSPHICSCMICLLTVGNPIEAGIPPQGAAEEIGIAYAVPFRSFLVSDIFHPPRV